MEENRKHVRVPLAEIRETPADGIYVTKAELRKYGIFAGIFLGILTVFTVFDRKG